MEIKDIRDKLPHRYEYPKRKINNIDTIDIHHSATLQKNYKGIDTIKSFANHHIYENGWPAIGYHYIIAPNGVVYKTGYANESRWSVGNHNSYTISIMLIGNFTKEAPTEKQHQSALELAKTLENAYHIQRVKGHNEFDGHAFNSCPGIDMSQFRNDLQKEWY